MTKHRPERAKAAKDQEPAVMHHTIVALELTGGFLRGVRLEFADGLNCIIGGRGTGKTTIIELIRYVLGLMPDSRVSPARAKALAGLVQTNLGNGKIRLHVETKHGMRYVAERPWNDSTQVLNEQGEATAIALDRDNIFTADVYSQNEIEEIATNPTYQLALIDKFVEEDIRKVDVEIRRLVRDLEQNAAELLRLENETRDLAEVASEAKALEEKLKAFQQTAGPDAKLVNAAHTNKALRERERKTLELLRGDVRKVAAEFDSLVTSQIRRLEARLDKDVLEGPNKAVFAEVAKAVSELTSLLERGSTHIGGQCTQAETIVGEQERRLAEIHAKQEQEYRQLVTQTEEERGRAAERAALQKRYVEVTTAQKEFEARQKERKSKEDQRRELTAKLSALRDERFRLRRKVADQLTATLKPAIRVTVTQAGSREGYKDLLTESLKGSGMRYAAVVDKIVQSTSPEEFAVLVQRGDHDRLADRAGVDQERARRVVELLRNTEWVYRAEAVELDDLPKIELLDGSDYKDSADLSTGQRCTTILPILLLESERPLLVDQPEDNLDNAFIYDTVVKNVKGAKGRRQLIFVTHNPNIPVLGDAERVFELASDGKHGSLAAAGTVDELKERVEALLEGGREAFLERKKRYGH